MTYTPERLVEDYSGAVARVVVEDAGRPGVGAAFHVGAGIFITARRVVRGRRVTSVSTTVPALASGADGRIGGARRLRTAKRVDVLEHERLDLACLRTDLEAGVHVRLGGATCAYAVPGAMLKPVVVMGFADLAGVERALFCTHAEINACLPSAAGAPHLVVSQIARADLTGGPVIVVETGECLGVVTHLTADQRFGTGRMFAVLTAGPILEMLLDNDLLPEHQLDARMLHDMCR